MDVILRTLCGAEQRLTLDPRDPVPDWIVVTNSTGQISTTSTVRRFQLRTTTDRYPFRVYKERTNTKPGKHERVATYVVVEEHTDPRGRVVQGSSENNDNASHGAGAHQCR